MRTNLNQATFNIISHGLHGMAQEMGEKLVRSAYSTIIREARDCSTSFLDRNGRIIAKHIGLLTERGDFYQQIERMLVR